MKICFLADGGSIHTKKWVEYFRDNGHKVNLITFRVNETEKINGVEIIKVKSLLPFSRLNYILSLNYIKKLIWKISPDILHSHYLTSYGFIGAFSGFKPFVVSIWGSDITVTPKKSFVFKYLTKWTTKKADIITVSSKFLFKELLNLIDKEAEIIPFGVDTNVFNYKYKTRDKNFKIGITKSLEDWYGHYYLILAFKKLSEKYKNLKLLIAGDGSKRGYLEELVKSLNLEEKVKFFGYISNIDLPKFLNKLDVFVMPSLLESFGVSAIESLAVGVPVVASNVGGIPEIVIDGKTGFLVESKNVNEIVNAVNKLLLNPYLREKMSKKGRGFVEKKYNFNKIAQKMELLYKRLVNKDLKI